MAVQFRNLRGNPYSGLVSAGAQAFGRVGQAYMDYGQARFKRNMLDAQEEQRRREREDKRYNSMIDSTIKGVGMAMQYDIEQDKIAQDNAFKRLQLEDSSFKILSRSLKPNAVRKLVSERNKYIDKISKGEDVDFGEGSFYGQELTDDDFIDSTRMTPDRLSKLSTAFKNIYKPINDRNQEIEEEFLKKWGKQELFGEDSTHRAYSYPELQSMMEDKEGKKKSIPDFYFADDSREMLLSEAEIDAKYQKYLKDKGHQEITWEGFLNQYGGGGKGQFRGVFADETPTRALSEESQSEEIEEVRKADERIAKNTTPAKEGWAKPEESYKTLFTGEVESILGTNQPTLSRTPTDDQTDSSNAEVVSLPADSLASNDTGMFAMEDSPFVDGTALDAVPKEAGEVTSSEPLAKYDRKKGIFVTPMITGDIPASKADVDAQFKEDTAVVTMPEFYETYEKQYGEIPEYVVQARQDQDEKSLLAKLSNERAYKNFYKEQERQDRITKEEKIDSGRAGFTLSDEELAVKEAEEKEHAETFAITSKLAVKDIESRDSFQGYVYNPDGTKDAIFDNDFVKSPRIAGSYEDEDVFSSLTEFKNKYAEYFEQKSDSGLSPAEHKQRAFTNRIIDIYSSATGSDDAKKKFTADQIQKQATDHKMSQMSGSGQSGLMAGIESKSFGEDIRSKAILELNRLTKPFPDNPTKISGVKGPKNLLEARIQQRYEDEQETPLTLGTFTPQEGKFFLENVAEGRGMDEEETDEFVNDKMAQRLASWLDPKHKAMVDKVKLGAVKFYNNIDTKKEVKNLGTVSPEEMDELVVRASSVYGVDAKILRTIIDSESNRRGHNGKGYDTLYVKKGDQKDGSDSFGVGQFGIGAYRQLEKTAGTQGMMWNMIKNGDAKSQINAVAMYVKNYIQPLLKKYRKDPNSPIEVGMVYKGGYRFDRRGNATISETAKKGKYLKKLAMFLRAVEGRARGLKASP